MQTTEIQVTSPSTTEPVTTPVHFVASLEGVASWLFAGAADRRPVYESNEPLLDGWALLPVGSNDLRLTAWNAAGEPILEFPLMVEVQGIAMPTPPANAQVYAADDPADWVPSSNDIGGKYQDAEILPFAPPPFPPPGGETDGLHFAVTSQPEEPSTDGLVAWTRLDTEDIVRAPLNAIWTFTFAVPDDANDVGAYETDFVFVVGGRQYNFSAQYARAPHTNPPAWKWDTWASVDGTKKGGWHAIPHLPGRPPFETDRWHTVTIFYQRVTRLGSDVFQSAGGTDRNTSMLYAVAQLDDDHAMIWNIAGDSIETDWAPQVKLQHQIDLAKGNVSVGKWVVGQRLTMW